MQFDARTTETIIAGMTKGEVAALIIGVIVCMGVVIMVLGYIMRLNLKPLENVPNDLIELKTKVKSGEELARMIDNRVLRHELECPFRAIPIHATRKINRPESGKGEL